MPNALELIGQTFGQLTVISKAASIKGVSAWNCECSCGKRLVVRGRNMTSGNTTSCGCKRKEALVKRNHRHGKRKTPEYRIWALMRHRCMNKNDTHYSQYGGRGIEVCERWSKFTNFYADMGPRPSAGHSIERIDNDGPYSPDNCRWATTGEQARNTQRTIHIEYMGKTQCLSDWCRGLGIPVTTAWHRRKRGLPVEEILAVKGDLDE